jgi:hypothetical protein
MYANTPSGLSVVRSIIRWKVCAALDSPNGVNKYSNKLNGVIIAVFGMSVAENRDLVITLHKMDFWKNVATMQAIGKVLNVWQRVLVRGCHQIEMAIIATRSRGSIFFGNHVQRRGPWWLTANYAGGFQWF